MKRDETVYLRHILDAINRIEEYLTGVDKANFQEQYLIQDGVIRQLFFKNVNNLLPIYRLLREKL